MWVVRTISTPPQRDQTSQRSSAVNRNHPVSSCIPHLHLVDSNPGLSEQRSLQWHTGVDNSRQTGHAFDSTDPGGPLTSPTLASMIPWTLLLRSYAQFIHFDQIRDQRMVQYPCQENSVDARFSVCRELRCLVVRGWDARFRAGKSES